MKNVEKSFGSQVYNSLKKVSVGIRTFLRDEKLFNCLAGIQEMLEGAKIIIADCGHMTEEKDGIYADLEREGHKVIHLPFDAGFGAMSNAIADALDRPYLLIGSDDFDFRPSYVREGIQDLIDVVENTDIDIASGRVRGPYEFDLEDRGDEIIEHRVQINESTAPWFVRCDLTVNYSLIRKSVFNKVRWDDNVKICGGEHGAMFVDIKRAGYKVAYVPGVHIAEQTSEDSELYKQYRSRGGSERPCFVKRGIRRYVLGNGRVDYDKVVGA